MAKYIKILVLFLTLSICGQNVTEMKTSENANEKSTEFIAKKKFVEENFYPGIADEKMRPVFTEKINQISSDYKTVAESEKRTDIKYQEKIEIGLSRFADIYLELDTEDPERVCLYIEEINKHCGIGKLKWTIK